MAEETQKIEARSSYRSIFKATSLFGGVQVYQILIQIIRSKFIAVILGPAGVGIQGLYHSATELIKSLTSLGLSQSAVRDVSEANASGNIDRVNRTVTVLRKLVWFTGSFGLIIVLLMSPLLSKWSFGNYDYAIPFAFLSITLLLDQLAAGQKVVLQGLRRLKDLAKASAYGSTVGLFITVPLYYYFKVNGIVPTLILNSAAMLLISWLFSRKVKTTKEELSPKEVWANGKQMMTLGIAMSVSAILVSISSYVLRGFIRSIGGTEEVGLYSAGFAIMTTYVGMFFNAMSTDYYPRLSAIQYDNAKCRELVNQQGEIASLIITPLLAICIIFMPVVIKILYSDRFLGACGYVLWASLGMMFKLGSWLLSYMFVAKGETKMFIVNEVISWAYSFICSLLGYKLGGLSGLGIAFCVSFIFYYIQVYLIAKIKYGFSFTDSFRFLFILQVIIIIMTLLIALFINNWPKYVIGGIVIIASSIYSIKEMNKRMDLGKLLKRDKNKSL